ncbi:MAG: M24 family metallopeptidase, partial [Bacteroidota bacterium]|nr:M24 family metallopeptidase [Bacteroidota bacterium]
EVQHIRLTVPTAEVIAVEDPFPEMRASKTAHELSAISMALEMSEAVFNGVLNMIREGVTEKDIAAEIDHQHRLRGASGPAFDTIVAFSENAALPHARPCERALKKGDTILMDFGGVVDGYHSDITRTVSFGRADKEFLEAYQAVKQSLEAATEYAEAGVQGVTLDRVARDVLTRHGYGARFTHSLGHGVGLEIHEYPSVSQRNPSPLPMDCVVTLEPGVYLEGHFGIRIENMVHLRKGTCDTLNTLSTDLAVL